MKCNSCKGEWTLPPGKTVTECPFCKESIASGKTPETFNNAKDALQFIADTYGTEALLAKNLFSDIAPNLNDERELIKMFREKGVLEVLKDALTSSPQEQEKTIKRAMEKLPSCLQNSLEAISLLNDFAAALGWINVERPVEQQNEKPTKSPVKNPTKTPTSATPAATKSIPQKPAQHAHIMQNSSV